MSRSQLIPVVTITDRRLFPVPTRVPDYLGAAYIDKIKNLTVGRKEALTAADEGYPELLSDRIYNTTDYWWILCMFNGCIDPLSDMQVGAVWSFPTADSIQVLLANTAGSRSNRIGSVVTI
jgi:hypothetical protein